GADSKNRCVACVTVIFAFAKQFRAKADTANFHPDLLPELGYQIILLARFAWALVFALQEDPPPRKYIPVKRSFLALSLDTSSVSSCFCCAFWFGFLVDSTFIYPTT